MVHILKLQLMIIERMNTQIYTEYLDYLINYNFRKLEMSWNRDGKSINELHNIMRYFCQKYNYNHLQI